MCSDNHPDFDVTRYPCNTCGTLFEVNGSNSATCKLCPSCWIAAKIELQKEMDEEDG